MKLLSIRKFLLIPSITLIFCSSAFAQSGPIIEFRRTFKSDKCDSGDVYINNIRSFLFISLNSVWDKFPKENQVNISIVKNRKIDVDYYPYNEQILSFDDEGGSNILNAVLLNDRGFSFFEKRILKNTPPEKTVYLGYKLFNRACRISASANENRHNNDDDDYYSHSTNIAGNKIFNIKNLEETFQVQNSKESILLTRDLSKKIEILIGSVKISQDIPPKIADHIGKDDPCLSKMEHMRNTIHYAGGVKYERRDDIVLCPNANFNDPSPRPPAIEGARDIRFLKFFQTEICATVLGIPVFTAWYIHQDHYGAGVEAATECLNGSYTPKQAVPVIQYQ